MSECVFSQYEKERGKPPPSKNHSTVEVRIGSQLESKYGEQYDFHIELDLNLETGKAVPDIAMYPLRPSNWLVDKKEETEPPLMVVAILSPNQGIENLTNKMELYFGAGVKSYWVVIPTFQTIHIITPDRKFVTFNGGIAKDPVFGLEVDMGWVFR